MIISLLTTSPVSLSYSITILIWCVIDFSEKIQLIYFEYTPKIQITQIKINKSHPNENRDDASECVS